MIAPTLCAPILLGLPFLSHNQIVIDHTTRTAVDKTTGFDLMNPGPIPKPKPTKHKTRDIVFQQHRAKKAMIHELNTVNET